MLILAPPFGQKRFDLSLIVVCLYVILYVIRVIGPEHSACHNFRKHSVRLHTEVLASY